MLILLTSLLALPLSLSSFFLSFLQIMLLHDLTGKVGTCKSLPDQVSVAEPKDEM